MSGVRKDDRLVRERWAERRYEGPVPEPVLRWLRDGRGDKAARHHTGAQAVAIERLARLTQRTLAKRRETLSGWTALLDRRLEGLTLRLRRYRARACALALSARA